MSHNISFATCLKRAIKQLFKHWYSCGATSDVLGSMCVYRLIPLCFVAHKEPYISGGRYFIGSRYASVAATGVLAGPQLVTVLISLN